MTTQIRSRETKTRLPELLRQVQCGKSFTITNRGEPVADLVPIGKSAGADAAQAAKDMEAFMRAHRVRGVDVKALTEYGRP